MISVSGPTSVSKENSPSGSPSTSIIMQSGGSVTTPTHTRLATTPGSSRVSQTVENSPRIAKRPAALKPVGKRVPVNASRLKLMVESGAGSPH
eukprot:gene13915-4079_t